MFDDQLAQNLSGKGALGFAQLIERQLGANLSAETVAPLAEALYQSARLAEMPRASGGAVGGAPARSEPMSAAAGANRIAGAENLAAAGDKPADFVQRLWPHAVEAGAALGVPPQFLIAQAALESGWGRHELRHGDGSPSFNVFGIKPGKSWEGAVTRAVTTEFINGVASRQEQPFRAYGSYREAFMDYAALLSSRARFQGVVGQRDGASFARGLQQAGYATDPMYADKLVRIIDGGTLRQALAGEPPA
jgi:flagellar protein FlgJ